MGGLLATLQSLETAEDFLAFFAIPFDQRVVDVNRLHILQRLHDRLGGADLQDGDDASLHATMRTFLEQAYRDFVVSDARTEKVFKVFRQPRRPTAPDGRAMVPLAEIRRCAAADGG